MENSSTPPTTATRKRKRIPIACSACRARKSRCDGARPSCSACVEQAIECVYAANSGASNALVPKQYLEQVENRLADVEEEISRLKRFVPGATSTPISKPHVIYPGNGSLRSMRCNFSESPFPDDSLHDGSISGISPDATDGVGTIEYTSEDIWAYFGSSSNIAFTRIIRRTLSHLLHKTQKSLHSQTTTSPVRTAQQNILAVSRSETPVDDSFDSRRLETTIEACRLPPEPEVSRLVRRYFTDTGLLFPYVHEDSFWKSYAQFRPTGLHNARHSWLALLNMILAMSTSTDNADGLGLADRQAISEVYYNRAKALSMGQIMHGASVEGVQVMLLMSQYLQGSQRSVQTWAIHGIAVKAALELGLHSELAIQRFDPLEREMRIRTWYGCMALDRTLSMTFGRPPIIPQTYIRMSLPKHFVHHSGGSDIFRWSKDENSTLFWNGSITLYGLTAAVIDELYESNIGSSATVPLANIVSTVIHVGQKFVTWQASLPPSMRLVDPVEVCNGVENTMSLKYRVILTLRYHNVHILSHRPILDRCLQSLDGSSHSAQESAALQQGWYLSKEACLASAENIIRLVEACKAFSDQQPAVSLLGAWWFSLYFTFNAALTLVAIKIIEESLSPSSFDRAYTGTVERLDEVLKDAVNCIARLDKQNPMVEKCAKFTATLVFLVQSLQAVVPTRDATGGVCGTSIHVIPPDGANVSNMMPANGTLDDAFTSLMNFLPPNFNDFSNTGATFAVSELMDDFATSDLFW
ncbi:fungal specific transcription factor domain-containing protein [Colletotrichum sojae]|uniref:Fungal specific transcription factor domain-containing protein n=1 Tax=Colletotrichum sojae TaxID=2175907 RepID=A0A8H6MRP3_9PEZI|nr:fungal specific transcription factor domain-containing protein [Colletotrichum sojae]